MRRLWLTATIALSVLSSGFKILYEESYSFQREKKVTFQLVQTFGAETSPKDALLSSISRVVVDKKGNIYINDKGERIVSFKPDGTLRWKADKKGDGPGDIKKVRGIATDGGKYLYLGNIDGSRIDKFDLSGKYINSINNSEIHLNSIYIEGFIKPNLLVVSQPVWGKAGVEVIIIEVDKNCKIKQRFIIDVSGDLKLSNGVNAGININISDNLITAGNCNEYKLFIYDINGNCVKTIKRNYGRIATVFPLPNGVSCAGDIGAPVKICGSFYLCPLSFPIGIESAEELRSQRGKIEYKRLLDIFDEAGNLIYSKEGKGSSDDEIGSIEIAGIDGYLYTSKKEPYPCVCKYKVIIENK